MNNEQPKISIIIPVYKKQRYIKKLLNMISKQTFTDYECILVDDGSPDECGKICDHFAENDSRFVVIHIPNGGVSHARNVGLDRAIGEYITFIDADDEITGGYLENLYSCIRISGADMVIGALGIFTDDSNCVKTKELPYLPGVHSFLDDLQSFAMVQQRHGIYGWCVAKLFPRAIVDDIRFTEGLSLAEDFDYYLKLYPKINTVFYDDKPYYLYRQEAENCSVAKNDADIDYLSQLKLNLRYRDFLQKMNSWSGENQSIVERLIGNYVYFALFYTSLDRFNQCFEELFEIVVREKIILYPNGCFQKILLGLLQRNKKYYAKKLIQTYRFIRRKVRRDG